MQLTLTRREFGPKATIGTLSIDGAIFCFTLEDKFQIPKVKGQTCIPFGTYEVIVNFSQRFQRPMPLLLNVPGFDGIRIHSGNTDADTEGCILLGKSKINDDDIGSSRAAFGDFFPKLEAALATGKVFIEIIDGRKVAAPEPEDNLPENGTPNIFPG